MKCQSIAGNLVLLGVLALSGCASGPGGSIYVPPNSSPDYGNAPQPPQAEPRSGTVRKSEQPAGAEQETTEPRVAPSHQQSADSLSPAAASLLHKADSLLAQGNAQGAVSQLERAQRISPRSVEVYYKLSQAYVSLGQLSVAEQFTLKGLSLAGQDTRLQRAGWMLLADIRRANGNTAGADRAEERAAAL